ncbi:baculoviral IAP repeat-containing protein 5 [Hylaeus anthracinus]|uniref:baculoviral IAP repeat-containing protein 5 n=1 Tax=Hylaeus anthracinus TaxID=313031 RepID=UPI0023B9B328|nr:baculoviral IAP repeat-containing protein 5 [Hylaeus anthracinus]
MDLLPEADSMFWKNGRLKTFEQWPFQSSDNSCNPNQMAAAGFHVIGGKEEPDLVQCFICSKQLDGWDPDDDPWDEHVKHQPQCQFVKLNKPDERSWTIQELFDLFKIYKVTECMSILEEAIDIVKEKTALMVKQIPRIYKESRQSYKNQN